MKVKDVLMGFDEREVLKSLVDDIVTSYNTSFDKTPSEFQSRNEKSITINLIILIIFNM